MFKEISRLFLLVTIVGWVGCISAQDDENNISENTRMLNVRQTPIGIPGEEIDIRTGAYYWEITDVTLPGTAGMDMKVIRSWNKSDFSNHRGFGNWEIETPRIQQTVHPDGSVVGAYCSNPSSSTLIPVTVNPPQELRWVTRYQCGYEWIYNPQTGLTESVYRCANVQVQEWYKPLPYTVAVTVDWFSGLFLIMPGEKPKQLLFKGDTTVPSGAKYVTTDNWAVKCTSTSNGVNGYIVTSPSGVTYSMDVIGREKGNGNDNWVSIFPMPGAFGNIIPGNGLATGYATQVTAYASSAVDRFGNTISYSYEMLNSSGGRWGSDMTRPMLTTMTSSDGRSVTFNYESHEAPFIESVVVNGQTWEYHYSNDRKYLTSVTLPDDSAWQYFYTGPTFISTYPSNISVDYVNQRKFLDKVITPQGLQISYTHTTKPQSLFSPYGSSSYDSIALKTRAAIGDDIAENSIEYTYTKEGDKNITVIAGDRNERYEYSRSMLLGSLLNKTIYDDDGVVLENQRNTWTTGVRLGRVSWIQGNEYPAEYRPLLTKTEINRDQADLSGFKHQINYENFDTFGRARRILEEGTKKRRTNITFYNKDAYSTNGEWLVGPVEDVIIYDNTNSASPVLKGRIDRTFNAEGLLEAETKFGIKQEFEYHSSGELYKLKFKRAADKPYIEVLYENYKLGTPQLETYPDSIDIERVVDDFGRVTSETDPDGVTKTIHYDALGRIDNETVPGEAARIIEWESPKRQKISKADYREINVYDSLGRIKLSEQYDVSQPSEKLYVNYEYDKHGNPIFESVPSSISNETKGERTIYDALGRKVEITHTADNSKTKYFYNSQWASQIEAGDPTISNIGFGVIDPLGYKRVYKLDAYGTPNDTVHKEINEQVTRYRAASGASPEVPNKYITTRLVHDVLGNISQVSQGGLVRSYTYYSGKPKLLQTVTNPETGNTTYTYDEAGNKVSQKTGSGETITYQYDDNNRLKLINYPTGTEDINYEYYPSGKMKSADNILTQWEYTYTPAGAIQSEALSLIGETLELYYDYDQIGNRSAITYPNGELIDLKPDALGRARRIGRYINKITYHPDGFIKSYLYRNGHIKHIEKNEKGLIEEIRSGIGSNHVIHQTYRYDLNNNVKEQKTISADRKIDMHYDGISRLKSAYGNSIGPTGKIQGDLWFAHYDYDDIGNITRKTISGKRLVMPDGTRPLSSVNIDYSYDAVTNLLETVSGGYSFNYDHQGNVTSNGKHSFIYDEASRLVSVSSEPNIEYIYDAHGHRVHSSKTKNGLNSSQYSVYNQDGILMYRKDLSNNFGTNYFYLAHRLVASTIDCSVGDADKDGIPDCVEDAWGLNKNNPTDASADRDGDGVSNLYEYAFNMNPNSSDTNKDGLSDLSELLQNSDGSYSIDSDHDGLTDLQEFAARANPLNMDSDNDGVIDGEDSTPNLNNGALVAILRILLN